MPNKIRVVVVDDSALMRQLIRGVLEEDGSVKVVALARDGEDALEKIFRLRPDVVTLDIELPKLDGIGVLQYVMSEWPTPIVMVSSYTQSGAQQTLKSLEYGAFDFVAKPSGQASGDISVLKRELLQKVKSAARADVALLRPLFAQEKALQKQALGAQSERVVAIGASTGGPRALLEVLQELPADLMAGILVVQHMPRQFLVSFTQRLSKHCALEVKAAQAGDMITQGRILIAPGGHHMAVEPDGDQYGRIVLNQDEKVNSVRPAADITMQAAAAVYGRHVLGVVLTGMGADGTQGLEKIKRFGGQTIVQDAATCVVNGMPQSAIDKGVADQVKPLNEISGEIVSWVTSQTAKVHQT